MEASRPEVALSGSPLVYSVTTQEVVDGEMRDLSIYSNPKEVNDILNKCMEKKKVYESLQKECENGQCNGGADEENESNQELEKAEESYLQRVEDLHITKRENIDFDTKRQYLSLSANVLLIS